MGVGGTRGTRALLATAAVFAASGLAACGSRSGLGLELVTPAQGDDTDASSSATTGGAEPPGADGGLRSPTSPDAGLDPSPAEASAPADAPFADAPLDAPADALPDAPVAAAPRPVAPLSTATATSQQPTLRWQLAPGSDGALVQICRDRACTIPVVTFIASGSSARPPAPLGAGVYFWRLYGTACGVVSADASPTWELFVGARSAPVDTSWGSVPDIDGDGLADAFTSLLGESVESVGVLFTYHGDKDQGLTPWSALASPTTTAAFWFGVITGMAGDVDGDGYADLLVSDQYDVWLYAGGPSGPPLTPVLVYDGLAPGGGLVNVISGLGDVDGDGYADVGIGVTTADSDGINEGGVVVYHGGPGGLATPPDPIMFSLFAAGRRVIGADINGDGYGDLVTSGCTHGDPLPCQAFFFAGGPGGLASSPVVLDDPSGSELGAVEYGGDMNGDGYADLLGVSADPSSTPMIHVFPGGPSGVGAPVVFVDTTTLPITAYTVVAAGDVNGDGYADLAVPFSTANATGAYVYEGSAGLWTQTWPTGGDVYGYRNAEVGVFAAAGDVNGDGYGDFLAGDPSVTNATYVFLGSASGLWLAPQVPYTPLEGGDSVL